MIKIKKLYAVEAIESEYQGLHGVISHFLTECDSFDEVYEEARLASEQLIYSYGLEPEPDGEDWSSDDVCAEAWGDHIMFAIWEIPDTKGHDIKSLEKLFNNRPNWFIQNYCIDC